jgi:hypothetical protein
VNYKSTSYYCLPRLFSNYSPIILDTGCINFPTIYHFRFDFFWISQEGFSSLVSVW